MIVTTNYCDRCKKVIDRAQNKHWGFRIEITETTVKLFGGSNEDWHYSNNLELCRDCKQSLDKWFEDRSYPHKFIKVEEVFR